MANEQKEFWSTVAQKYDRVVDLQIGETTRSMVWDRVMKEGRLGELACIVSVMFRGCSQGHCDGATQQSDPDTMALTGMDVKCFQISVTFRATISNHHSTSKLYLLRLCLHALRIVSRKDVEPPSSDAPARRRVIGRDLMKQTVLRPEIRPPSVYVDSHGPGPYTAPGFIWKRVLYIANRDHNRIRFG